MAVTLYVEPNTHASAQANAWRTSNPAGAALLDKIALRAQALWLGEWSGDVRSVVDNAVTIAGTQRRVFVAYYIPQRDGTAWSAGGAPDTTSYWKFIAAIARGLRGRKAIVILEPDAICHTDFMSPEELDKRLRLLAAATDTLMAAGASGYIDAGDSDWIPSAVVAERLLRAGVKNATGFALNVSHTEPTANEIAYADKLRAIVGLQAKYIIDTSRNARKDPEWCNPPTAGLGKPPTLVTSISGCDGFLWVKRPGESDGQCNKNHPDAGKWWLEGALELARRSV